MKHVDLGTLEVSRIGLGSMGIIYGSVVNVRYPAWGRLLELGTQPSRCELPGDAV